MLKGSKHKKSSSLKISKANFQDLTGYKIGKWSILKRMSPIGDKVVMWTCRCECGKIKIISADSMRKGKSNGCLACMKTTHGLKGKLEFILFHTAKYRAKKKGLKFNLNIDDIKIPEKCPLLGIKLQSSKGKGGGGRANSPSLDRIIPDKGYTKGNIWVISFRANRIKTDASLKELETLVKNFKKALVA